MEDTYARFATKVKVANLEKINDRIFLITTNTHINENDLSEVQFKITVDMKHGDQIDLLNDWGDYEGVSLFDFIRIKSLGRKVYKFFSSHAQIDIQTIKTPINLNSYDGVKKVKRFYGYKVNVYQLNKENIMMTEDQYHENLENLRAWDQKLRDLQKDR